MDIITLSKIKGFQASFTRIQIFNFMKNTTIHPTVNDIYHSLKQQIPTLSKTTVYNVLALFVENEICQKISTKQHETRYDLVINEHSHFLCSKCDTIFDIPKIKTKINYNNLDEFDIQKQYVILQGICPSCK